MSCGAALVDLYVPIHQQVCIVVNFGDTARSRSSPSIVCVSKKSVEINLRAAPKALYDRCWNPNHGDIKLHSNERSHRARQVAQSYQSAGTTK